MFKPTVAALSMATLLVSCEAAMPDLRRMRQDLEVPEMPLLDQWIAQREQAVPHLRKGVEAQILWANPGNPQQTELALVYLPGYTATRGEMAPVPDLVAAELGANLYYSRPTGQGSGPGDHKSVTARQWVRDALEALAIGRKIGKKVVIMGTSTGGTLATLLNLSSLGEAPDATILVSPNLTPADPRSELLLWPFASLLVKMIAGKEIDVEARSPQHGHFWDLKHDPHSLIPMMRLVKWARSMNFSRWSKPVLVVYDRLDSVVNESVTVRRFESAPADLVTWLEWKAALGDDHHVLAGDILSPHGTQPMVRACVDYLRGVFGKS